MNTPDKSCDKYWLCQDDVTGEDFIVGMRVTDYGDDYGEDRFDILVNEYRKDGIFVASRERLGLNGGSVENVCDDYTKWIEGGGAKEITHISRYDGVGPQQRLLSGTPIDKWIEERNRVSQG